MINRVVLDTNILLDLLHFENPDLNQLRQDLDHGSIISYTNTLILEEFAEVIARPAFKNNADKVATLIQKSQHLSQLVDDVLPKAPLKCKDRDDQIFINLAFHLAPCSLISKDNEVLRLAGRAKPYQVEILKIWNR
jgi:putative PIN family toxin of toxin-antitoxin system